MRQILFDPGSTFGGKMLVTTSSGLIISVDSSGIGTTIASVGEDTEGMDIASNVYGKYAGQLLVASEGSGTIRAISPTGDVTILKDSSGANIYVQLAETVSVIPIDLGQSNNPIEGFYVANYPYDIQFADSSQFSGLEGNAIITSELPSNSGIWDLAYNGDLLDSFTLTQIGNLPYQSEDGIFVTAQRITDTNIPEPASLALLGIGLAGMWFVRRRV